MEKLGLIGDTGLESTLLYYRKFVYETNKRVGDIFFPSLIIESINVYDALAMCGWKGYEALTKYLVKAVGNLVVTGAEVVILTGSIPHITFDELQSCTTVPPVNIIESTRAEVQIQSLIKVGLVGTRFTMETDFFKRPFTEVGIQVVILHADEVDYTAEETHDELERGIVKSQTRDTFIAIIERVYQDEDIEAIILGCTEFPLLSAGTALPVRVLDTVGTRIETSFKAFQ